VLNQKQKGFNSAVTRRINTPRCLRWLYDKSCILFALSYDDYSRQGYCWQSANFMPTKQFLPLRELIQH